MLETLRQRENIEESDSVVQFCDNQGVLICPLNSCLNILPSKKGDETDKGT